MLATAVHVTLNAEVKHSVNVNVTVTHANNVNVTSRVIFFLPIFTAFVTTVTGHLAFASLPCYV